MEGSIDGWVDVKMPTVPTKSEAVFLGNPTVMWAPYNVGASSPEECGDYFAWGEVETKSNYSWSTYKWGSPGKYLKYGSSYDDYTVIQPDDDVAQVKWGNGWRMPTKDEIDHILKNCRWELTQIKGVNGYKVTYEYKDDNDNSISNSIFLPAAGCYEGTSIQGCGTSGYYYSTLFDQENKDCAYAFYFHISNSSSISKNSSLRYCGFTVRPVISRW